MKRKTYIIITILFIAVNLYAHDRLKGPILYPINKKGNLS